MTSGLNNVWSGFNKVKYEHFTGAESDTTKLISNAAFDNFFNGRSSGVNEITLGKSDGLSNRNATFKDAKFFNKNGYYPDATKIWIG